MDINRILLLAVVLLFIYIGGAVGTTAAQENSTQNIGFDFNRSDGPIGHDAAFIKDDGRSLSLCSGNLNSPGCNFVFNYSINNEPEQSVTTDANYGQAGPDGRCPNNYGDGYQPLTLDDCFNQNSFGQIFTPSVNGTLSSFTMDMTFLNTNGQPVTDFEVILYKLEDDSGSTQISGDPVETIELDLSPYRDVTRNSWENYTFNETDFATVDIAFTTTVEAGQHYGVFFDGPFVPGTDLPGQSFAGGDGSASNPYVIKDWNHLNNTRTNLTANYTLASDLNESSDGYDKVASQTANENNGFIPIGNSTTPFTGSFNSENHTIASLTINRSGDRDIGLFGTVGSNGTVTDTNLENANVTGSLNVGALAGTNTGTITTSSITGNATSTSTNQSIDGKTLNGNNVGGLVGANTGIVNDSRVTANVSGGETASAVGGAVGDNAGVIRDSQATSTVTGGFGDTTNRVGGLVGDNSGKIDSSHSASDVNGRTLVGGLAGDNRNEGTVTHSNATGDINGTRNVGGLVGSNAASVNSSYATGVVTGDSRTGGLVGQNPGVVNNSYATGTVTASDQVGGLAGVNLRGRVTNTSATGSVSGLSQVGGLIGTNAGGDVSMSHATGAVQTATESTDSTRIGGLVGESTGGHIERATANGTVTARNATHVGGLVGYNSGQRAVATVIYSRAIGDVVGDTNVGGLIGSNYADLVTESYATGDVTALGNNTGGLIGLSTDLPARSGPLNATVTNTYATGDVTAKGESVGGLVGNNSVTHDGESVINNSYAAGVVAGNDPVGGLVGTNSGSVNDAYWDIASTRQSNSGGNGVGLTTSQLKANTSLAGFDFPNTWSVVDNDSHISYPYLPSNTQTPAPGIEQAETETPTPEPPTDTTPPSITSFATTNPSSQNVSIGFASDEALSVISVSITGAESATLTESEFNETNTTSDTMAYNATYEGSIDGDYTATLKMAADDAGNDGARNQTNTVTIRTSTSSSGSSSSSSSSSSLTDTTDTETSIAVDEEPGDGEGSDDGGDGGTDDTTPDTTVSVSNPQPGQTLVIENGQARIVDTDTAPEADTDDGQSDDAAGESDTGGSDDGAGNVRADRLSVDINTDQDFTLSVTTYENDLTRSATAGQRSQPALAPPVAGAVGAVDASIAPRASPPKQRTQVDAPDAVRAAAESFEADTATVSAGYVDVEHTLGDGAIAGATFAFSIRRAYLEELGVTPEDVTLYHRLDGEWETRETDYVDSDETYHRFEGTMPEFSVFALGTGAATIEPTAATVDVATIDAGAEATVTATVTNRGRTTAEDSINLTLDGDVVATETVTLDGGASQNVTFTVAPDTPGEYDLAVGAVDLDPLTVEAPDDDPEGTNSGPPWEVIGIAVVLVVVLALGIVALRRR